MPYGVDDKPRFESDGVKFNWKSSTLETRQGDGRIELQRIHNDEGNRMTHAASKTVTSRKLFLKAVIILPG